MNYKKQLLTIVALCMVSSCASRSKSLILGGATGIAIGASSGAIANNHGDQKQMNQNIGIGAAVGLGIGILTSYLLHDHVNDRLANTTFEMDDRIQFGDVPPNPFSPNYGFKPKKQKNRRK